MKSLRSGRLDKPQISNFFTPEPNKKRTTFAIVLAALLLLIGVFLHLSSGSLSISWQALMQGLDETQALVFWELRIPRVLLVVLVGASLAVAGVALQAMFRNPLAEPGLIGVSSSAALGAVFVIVAGGVLWGTVASWQIVIAALLAALAATAFIYRISTHSGKTDVALMLLAGVAINAIAAAATQFLVLISDDVQLRTVVFWMMGSFANSSDTQVLTLASLAIIISFMFWRLAHALNAFLLGEDSCLHLGFDAARLKSKILWGSSLLVAVAVASVGVIAFVGLIVPHIARLWVGSNHRYLLPVSALLGAVLMVYADWFAKTMIAPAEMPIGLFMALLGGPFFLFMLLQQRRFWSR